MPDRSDYWNFDAATEITRSQSINSFEAVSSRSKYRKAYVTAEIQVSKMTYLSPRHGHHNIVVLFGDR